MILTLALFLASTGNFQEDKEPPLLFTLETGGRKTSIEQNKPFDLDTTAGKTSFVLRVEPFRLFTYGGVSFRYPREFGFEADLTADARLWTLDGNNCVLMFHRYPGQDDPEAALKSLLDAVKGLYRKEDVQEGVASIVLEGKPVKGTKLILTVAGQKVTQCYYPSKAGKDAILLMTQDAPKEDGTPTAEFQNMEKLLQETFKVISK